MPPSEITRTARAERRTNVRYLILLTIFAVTTLNYADRATLSITGPAMRHAFGFDAVSMGYVFSAFGWAYVLLQIPAGWLLDRFSSYRVYAVSILAWSAFTLLQGATGSIGGAASAIAVLFALRFAMGIAEAPAFPANAKIVAAWFPATERGTASAIFNAAQYFAAVIFTPLMAWITHAYGWRHVYVAMGALGIALALAWVRFMKAPMQHPRANRAELDYIAAGGGIVAAPARAPRHDAEASRTWRDVRQLLSNRMLLGVYLAQFCINVLTYFFLTWFPVYLVQARGMTILHAGLVASLPAICGFAGGVLGGVFSDALIRHGFSLTSARKLPIVGGMLLSASIVGCNYVHADWLVVALMSLAFFGKGVGALGWAVIADTSPKEAIGLSGSIFNMFGNFAGIVTPIAIGYLVASSGSFDGALVFVGINAIVTIFSYLVIVGKIGRVTLQAAPSSTTHSASSAQVPDA